MSQDVRDRILQLVVMVQGMGEHLSQPLANGLIWSRLLEGVVKANELCPTIVGALTWSAAYPGIRYGKRAAYVSFVCGCGVTHCLQEDHEQTTCGCGRTYRLSLAVEVERRF